MLSVEIDTTNINLDLDRAIAGRARVGHLPLLPTAGVWVSNSLNGVLNTTAHAANGERIGLFASPWAMTVDQVGINIAVAAAGQNCKIVCYESDVNGRPGSLVFESGNISVAATGTFTLALAAPVALSAGRRYWLGTRSSGTPTLRSPAAQSTFAIAWTTADPPLPQYVLSRTLAYATPATPWVYDNSQLIGNLPHLVLLRTA